MKILNTFAAVLFLSAALLSGCQNAPQGNPAAPEATGKNGITVLAIGTADSGGTMYPAGRAIAQLINDSELKVELNVSASQGSSPNAQALGAGDIDLGLISADVAYAAVNGLENFEQAPVKKLRAVAAIYPSLSNWMARSSSGLVYVHDLLGKKIGVGPQDSTTELSAAYTLSSMGITKENSSFINSGLGSGAEDVLSGKLDVIYGFAGVPINGLTELADSAPSVLLQYTDQELSAILEERPYYYQEIIPAGTYKDQTKDVATFGTKCLLCVNEDMDEELVYQITSVLYEGRERLGEAHPAMQFMAEDGFMYQKLPIKLHPGALRFYQEQGLLPVEQGTPN